MSSVPNEKSEPTVLAKSTEVIVSKEMKSLKNLSCSNRKRRITGDVIDRHKTLFEQVYATCHGSVGTGEMESVPDLIRVKGFSQALRGSNNYLVSQFRYLKR